MDASTLQHDSHAADKFNQRRRSPALLFVAACVVLGSSREPCLAQDAPATHEVQLGAHNFTLPTGLTVEQVAGPELVKRPVSAAFDDAGRLYVTDSSGSNDPVKKQLEDRPHRIMRLTDNDGDGVFDSSTEYANKLMFPEGALWHAGSLYVAAPPQIWKFTDADGDGKAEKREVWFDGKTLTGCANDLHGPYLGPDGWIYWCKGAFAEQTYARPDQTRFGLRDEEDNTTPIAPWTTKASHIFRRRPEGGPLDVVMTGGMDNPVELAFSPGGERFFTTTFLVHPKSSNRDGLIHAIYGAVYGKDHHVLDGHPRTGTLQPPMVHLGPAAPCGLTQLASDGLGSGFRHNLLATLFSMRKITRHELSRHGGSFKSKTTDLLVSDQLDFHPTDVLEDADGSVLVVDTGGWFRLCCPTSQLAKPDVLGGIYRIRPTDRNSTKTAGHDSHDSKDPRGRALGWKDVTAETLAARLGDSRWAVRDRAKRALVDRNRVDPSDAVEALSKTIRSPAADVRREVAWALAGINSAAARELNRSLLNDSDSTVQHAALHSVSLHRDTSAAEACLKILNEGDAHLKRVAAEALGRIGAQRHDKVSVTDALLSQIPATIESSGEVSDRHTEHSLIFACMELADIPRLTSALDHPDAKIRRAAAIALDQIPGEHLDPATITPWLTTDNTLLQNAAWWVAEQHSDWTPYVASALARQLNAMPTGRHRDDLVRRLSQFSVSSTVQKAMAETLGTDTSDSRAKTIVLDAIAAGTWKTCPPSLRQPLGKTLVDTPPLRSSALSAMAALGQPAPAWSAPLKRIASDTNVPTLDRLQSLKLLAKANPKRPLDNTTLEFLCRHLDAAKPIMARTLSVDILLAAKLTPIQLQRVANQFPAISSLELRPLLSLYSKATDDVGVALIAALNEAPVSSVLLPNQIDEVIAPFGPRVKDAAAPLINRIKKENQNKLQRVESVLALLPEADVRRGLQVFQSAKASCIACHRRGYKGGEIGPNLNRIGSIRSHRALVESILFPSMSFVRSYEPTTLRLADGRLVSGLVRSETPAQITLQLDAQRKMVIPQSEIEARKPSEVSIMPAGLEKQLSPQDLADLVKYLKEGG